jgi:hypothetical protein
VFGGGLEIPVPIWTLFTAYTITGRAGLDPWRKRLAEQVSDEVSADPAILTFLTSSGYDPEVLFGLTPDHIAAKMATRFDILTARRHNLRNWLANEVPRPVCHQGSEDLDSAETDTAYRPEAPCHRQDIGEPVSGLPTSYPCGVLS